MKNISYLNALRKTAKYHIRSFLHPLVKPLKLRLAVTNRCNSHCIMCNVWKMSINESVKNKELSVEEYEKIFKTSKKYLSSLNHISITGGEPILRNDLIDIFRVITNYFPKSTINVNTNAFNTERLLRFVNEAITFSPKLTIMVSLDGIGEAHDIIRGTPGAYKKVSQSLNELLLFKKGHPDKIKIKINHILSKYNYKEFEKVNEFCKNNHIEIIPIILQKGEFFNNLDLDIALDSESTNYLITIFEKLLSDEKNISLNYIDILEQLKGRERDYRCWAGKILLLIEEEGDVYPNGGCLADWDLGNLRDYDYNLEKIVTSKKAKTVFKLIKKCRRCRLACETLTTLREPEALSGYRKIRHYEKRNRQ